jgi:anti-sigma factor RsiW
MNCQRVLLRLSAYQDRELSVLEARQIENHLENCATCRIKWQAMHELIGHLSQLTPTVIAPDFSARVMAGLQTRPEKKYRLLPSFAYTLALVVIFIGGFLLEMSANGQPAAAPQLITTFNAVLEESRELGLLAVQDSTLELLSNLKQISLVKKQDNLLSKLPILRSRVSGDTNEKQ